MSLIFEHEMMTLFGGRDQLRHADEIEVQQQWLVFQAKLDAQHEANKPNS